jgi:Uma2 family endonuclease
MTTGTRITTAEDLWAMSSDTRRELVHGEVRTMAPAGFEHGAVIINISVALAVHVKAHCLGVVVGAETGFILARNPDTVRGADVAFVQAARIPSSGLPVKFWDGAPDLAVEVVSPDDTAREVATKVDDYLRAGARMALVVNPRRRTVGVHSPGVKPVVLRDSDTIDFGDVIPGLRLRLGDVFSR